MTKLLTVIAFILLFSLNAYAGDTSNLEGAWLLNETSGSRSDQTTNGNTLTDNNTVGFGTGQFGNAADFEKDNLEYLSITDASQSGLDITGNFTILYWAKYETLEGGPWTVDKAGAAPAHADDGYGVVMNNSSGTLTLRVYDTSAVASVTTLSTATWYHFAWVYDGSDAYVYIDGTEDNTATATTDPVNNAKPFVVGASSGLTGNIDGLVDEVAIFSRALSSVEINDIMDNGLESFMSSGRTQRAIVVT